MNAACGPLRLPATAPSLIQSVERLRGLSLLHPSSSDERVRLPGSPGISLCVTSWPWGDRQGLRAVPARSIQPAFVYVDVAASASRP